MSTTKNETKILTELFGRLNDRGYRAVVVPVERLRDLEETYRDTLDVNRVDPEILAIEIEDFSFEPPPSFPGAESVIVVAAPDSELRVTFTRKGERVSCVVPPTYLHPEVTRSEITALMAGVLSPAGLRTVEARLPEKLLAACTGLAEYGRNNIAYVEGMGSYFRPFVFFSDLAVARAVWRKPKMIEACATCSACSRRCPAGAITESRFVVRAERCLTFHNEKKHHIPFPEWIDASWHHCLVGCLDCQRVCPVNRGKSDDIQTGPLFNEGETEEILDAVAVDEMSASTANKLRESGLIRLLDPLPRNLAALLAR